MPWEDARHKLLMKFVELAMRHPSSTMHMRIDVSHAPDRTTVKLDRHDLKHADVEHLLGSALNSMHRHPEERVRTASRSLGYAHKAGEKPGTHTVEFFRKEEEHKEKPHH